MIETQTILKNDKDQPGLDCVFWSIELLETECRVWEQFRVNFHG